MLTNTYFNSFHLHIYDVKGQYVMVVTECTHNNRRIHMFQTDVCNSFKMTIQNSCSQCYIITGILYRMCSAVKSKLLRAKFIKGAVDCVVETV